MLRELHGQVGCISNAVGCTLHAAVLSCEGCKNVHCWDLHASIHKLLAPSACRVSELKRYDLQEYGLFDRVGGVSPADASTDFGNTDPDMTLTNPTHPRYASAADLGQAGPSLSRFASPESQPGSLAGWPQFKGRGLLDQTGHVPTQIAGGTQASPHTASLVYDECLLTRHQQQASSQQVPTTGPQQQ